MVLNSAQYILLLFWLISLFFISSLEANIALDQNIEQKTQLKCITSFTGLAFSPYIEGQDPANGIDISPFQIRQRLALIEGSTAAIRTYGSRHGLEMIGRLAAEYGIKKTALGAWLDSDLASNKIEIENLIKAVNSGDVDVAIVGNEVLTRGDLSVKQLKEYIEYVRSHISKSIPLTTAETYSVWLQNAGLLDVVDVVYAHIHPFWDGVRINNAMKNVKSVFRSLERAAGSKSVVIAETGWPFAGKANRKAIPSRKNALFYLNAFLTWAHSEAIEYYFFEAFDESWKTRAEGEQGAHWGIFDKKGRLKINCSPINP